MKFVCSSYHGPKEEIDAETPGAARDAYLAAHPTPKGYDSDVTVAHFGDLT